MIRLDSYRNAVRHCGYIEHNTFVNNSHSGNSERVTQTIAIQKGIPVSLKNNHFDNKDATYEVSMDEYSGTWIDASGCYWGGLSYVNMTHR